MKKTQAIHRSNYLVKICHFCLILELAKRNKKFPGRIERTLINAAGVYCSQLKYFLFAKGG